LLGVNHAIERSLEESRGILILPGVGAQWPDMVRNRALQGAADRGLQTPADLAIQLLPQQVIE
jgi:hypothetical protein